MEQKSIVIIRVKKKMSCPCHVIFTGATFIFFRDVCKLPSVVNFDCDLSMVIDPAEVHYNFRVKNKLISANCRMCYEHLFFWIFWRYYHEKSVQIIVFFILCLYFEVISHGIGARYNFFLDSLTFKPCKKCVTNIIEVLDIIWKKMQNMGT